MDFTKEQNDAIESIGQNTIVSASAGSGKTTIMMEKVARLISDELVVDGPKIDTNSMLIVTFTKASARDLKNKTAKKLKALINSTDDIDKQEYLKKQLEELPLASISTLHSFCNSIIREFFSKLDIDPAFSVMEEDESNIILNKAISNIIKSHSLDESEEYLDLNKMLKSDLVDALKDVYQFVRVSNINEEQQYQDNILDVNNEDDVSNNILRENALMNNLRFEKYTICYKRDLLKKAYFGYIARLFEEFIKKGEELLNDNSLSEKEKDYITKTKEQCETIYSRCVSDKPTFDGLEIKLPIKSKGLRDDLVEYKDEVNQIYSNGIKEVISAPIYNDYDERLIKKFMDLIAELDSEYSKLKLKDNKLDFSDLEHFMIKLLNDKECKNTLKERYRYIFVDEYQDINSVQEEIINKLSSNNNLFMVGDVKQSIYGFRHTDPSIFLNKVDRYSLDPSQGRALMLKSNYRSRREILEFCNILFSGCMKKETSGIDYKNEAQLVYGQKFYDCAKVDPIISIKVFEKPNKVEKDIDIDVYSVKKDVNNISVIKGEAEGKYISDKIKYLVNNKKIVKEGFEKLVESRAREAAQLENCEYNSNYLQKFIEMNADKECSDYLRNIEYKDITILCRSRSAESLGVIQSLIQNGIPVDAAGVSADSENEIVMILVSLLKIIDNPYDDINLVSVLLSNFGGFTQDELANIKCLCECNYEDNFYKAFYGYNKEDEIKSKIEAFKEKLKYYKFKASFTTVDKLLEEIVQENLFAETLAAKANGSKLSFQVKTFINQLKGKSYNVSLSKFLGIVNENPNILRINSTRPSSDNCVYVTTIHSSKGLQFPVVFLINMTKSNKSDSTKYKTNKDFGVMFNHIDKEVGVFDKSKEQLMVNYLSKKQEITEEMRLLYVALTRAKEYLFVSGVKENKNKVVRSFEDINSFYDMFLLANKENPNLFLNYLEEDEEKEEEEKEETKVELFKDSIDEEILEKVQNQIQSEYKYKTTTSMSIVKTVTEANKAAREDIEKEDVVGEFITKVTNKHKSRGNKTSEGTAYHHVMEIIDFENYTLEDVKEAMDIMLKQGQITYDEAEIVNPSIILNCLESDLMQIARHSECFREKKFKMYIPSNDIFNDGIEDKILLQGTIDLIIKDTTNNQVILVDYKYSKEDLDTIKQTYKVQLDLYQKAIETCMGVKVDRKLIYVLGQNQIIEY